MKKTKKFVSFLLTMVMILTMTTTAFAAQEGTLTGGSITIDNAVAEQTYSIYQILYLESYDAGTGAYSYKANSAWAEWLKTQTTYVAIDDQGYVTWVTGADAAAFAKAAQAYAKAKSIAADASKTALMDEETKKVTVEFTGLKLGYYLVDSTLGTLCSLDTTNPAVTIKEKNGTPTNEKKVEEDSTPGTYGSVNDADLKQTVNFKSTITAQAGAENYVFHDKMSAGLTFGSVTGITLNGTAVEASNYTVKTTDLTDDCTFEVVFTQAFCDTLKANDQIVISYTATLNANAVVGLPGNPNESKLEYGDEGNTTTTPSSTTTTYTWDMDILKYANGDESNVLAGAQFVLLNKNKDKVATVEGGKLTGWVEISTITDNGVITWPTTAILTTDADGKISIDGLDADTYYLREIKAPDGYNKLAEDKKVEIKGATEAEGSDTLTYTTHVEKVNNQSGTELPSTGGMGTQIFYIIGSVLVLGAAVLLVTRRRMSVKNDN